MRLSSDVRLEEINFSMNFWRFGKETRTYRTTPEALVDVPLYSPSQLFLILTDVKFLPLLK